MTEVRRGRLIFRKGKDGKAIRLIEWTSRKGKTLESNVNARPAELAADLTDYATDGIEVDYELSADGSFPARIRRRDEAWTGTAAPPPSPPRGARRAREFGGRSAGPQRAAVAGESGPRPQGHFHNPYNFIPGVPQQPAWSIRTGWTSRLLPRPLQRPHCGQDYGVHTSPCSRCVAGKEKRQWARLPAATAG